MACNIRYFYVNIRPPLPTADLVIPIMMSRTPKDGTREVLQRLNFLTIMMTRSCSILPSRRKATRRRSLGNCGLPYIKVFSKKRTMHFSRECIPSSLRFMKENYTVACNLRGSVVSFRVQDEDIVRSV